MGSVLRNHAVAERLPHENPEQLLSLEGRKVGHTGETLSTRQAYSRNIRVSGSQGPSYYAVGGGVGADRAGGDEVDAHALRPEVAGEVAADRLQRRLGDAHPVV